jgi:two-component system response regulator DesR
VIRVVLAEDQAMVLGALAALLEIESDLEVVGWAADGRQALQLCEELRPDVLVTDIEMPDLPFSEAIGKLGAAQRIEAARIARDKGWL